MRKLFTKESGSPQELPEIPAFAGMKGLDWIGLVCATKGQGCVLKTGKKMMGGILPAQGSPWLASKLAQAAIPRGCDFAA